MVHVTQDEDVAELLEEEDLFFTFHNNDHARAIKTYDTNIMGHFACYNPKCESPGWYSKMIPIVIRLYRGNKYNARVYHQRCKCCQWLSQPVPNYSYAERVAYRLKEWSGVAQEKTPRSRKSTGPHQSWLCEGCKDGHCKCLRR